MISVTQLAWAAGFLEGEGTFSYFNTPVVTAAQVEKEPIDRLVSLFGGRTRQRTTAGFSDKPIWVWRLKSNRSIQVMMTLYTFMSPKRKAEIERAVLNWSRSKIKRPPGSKVCVEGHDISGYNAIVTNGYVKCRECRNNTRRLWRERNRVIKV